MRKLAVLLATLGLVVAAKTAQAAKPEDVFGGHIQCSDKPFPLEAKSPAAYISAVKKQSKDRFMEDKEKGQWKIYYAAFFKKPLNDLEIKVTIYDVSDGSQRFVDSWEEWLNDRNQRVITGNMKLKRQEGKLDANSKLLMVMEDHGRIIASVQFYVLGEKKKFSGKVEFTDEDTKQKGDDDSDDADQQAADKAKAEQADPKKAPAKPKK
jgi:hypothetical protein